MSCGALPVPFGRSPVPNNVSNFSHYEVIRAGNVTGSPGRLGCLPGYVASPGSDFQRLTNVPMVEVSTNSCFRRSVMALPAVSMEWPVRSLISR